MLRFIPWADPLALAAYLGAILLAVTVHEFAHAWAADRLGDPTPRREGRLTLNPLAHLDPVGGLMLLLFGFGWARPVPVNPWFFRDARKGMLLVALAGPLANVVLAWMAKVLLELLLHSGQLSPWAVLMSPVGRFLRLAQNLNLWLAAFNLIPVPPLDGSRVLAGLLGPAQAAALARLEAYGPLFLVLLIASGASALILHPIYRLLVLLIGGLS